MISSVPLKMGRGRPRKKNVAVATVASPMTPDVRNALLVGADCQSCVMRISGREVESVGDTRTVRQFNIKWKDSPDWTWVNEEDFLKLINTMAAVVDVYTTDRPESKVQLEPVAGRRNFLAIAGLSLLDGTLFFIDWPICCGNYFILIRIIFQISLFFAPAHSVRCTFATGRKKTNFQNM
jgi:hypothetical protein